MPSTPSFDPAPVTERVLGHYRLLRELGRGAQGLVFLAEDVRLSRKVALKVFTGAFTSPGMLGRFQREALAASRLDHPGICSVYEAGEAEGVHFIAMRYVEGDTLARRLAAAREAAEAVGDPTQLTPIPGGETLAPLPGAAPGAPDAVRPPHEAPRPARKPRRGAEEASSPSTRAEVQSAVLIIEKAGRALHAAHEAGLIHRDIKPGNIMVTREGEPVVLDFGLARDEESDAVTLTHSGDLLGTPAYMSPEQLLAHRVQLDRRTDVYSLGATLFECLTGRRPFDAPSRDTLYQQILAAPLPDPSRLNPSIPRDLKVILQTALERDRERRYRTALDFAEDLRRFRQFEPIHARPAGVGLRFRRWTQRNPVLATVTLGVFVVLLAGLCVSLAFLQRVNHEKQAREAALVLARQRGEETEMALGQLRVESEARAQALRERESALTRAEGLYLSAQASIVLPRNPTLALLLGIEAARRYSASIVSNVLLAALRESRELRALDHGMPVLTAVFSPDGKKVLTTTELGARIWDAASGDLLAVLHGPRAEKTLATFSPDGRFVLTASWGGRSTLLWETASGGLLRELEAHNGIMAALAFSPDGRLAATASRDGTVKVFSVSDGRRTALLRSEGGGIDAMAVSSDGRTLLTTADGTQWTFDYSGEGKLQGHTSIGTPGVETSVRVWDVEAGRARSVLAGHWGKVIAALSPDGLRVATVQENQSPSHIRLWDSGSGELITTLKSWPGTTVSLAFAPDGTKLLRIAGHSHAGLLHFGDADESWARTFHLLDAATGEETARFIGHEGPVVSAEFDATGRRVVSASRDGTARLWDTRTGDRLAVLQGHEGEVMSAAFDPGGERLLTASSDGTARIWNAAEADPFRARVRDSQEKVLAISPAGGAFLVAREDGVEVREMVTGRTLAGSRRPKGGGGLFSGLGLGASKPPAIRAGTFSADGRRLLIIDDDGAVVRDARTGKLIARLMSSSEGGSSLISAIFSADGRRVLGARAFTAGFLGPTEPRVFLWDSETGKVLGSRAVGGFNYPVIALSADGSRALTATPQESIVIWSPGAEKPLVNYKGVGTPEGGLSADGRLYVMAGSPGALRVMEVDSGKLVSTILLGSFPRFALFSPDGSKLIADRPDSTVSVFKVETGEELVKLVGHVGAVREAAISADGRKVATASADRTARVWDTSSGAELLVCPTADPDARVAFTPDGGMLLVASPLREVRAVPLDLLPEARRRAPRDLTPAERDRYQVGGSEERKAYRQEREAASDLLELSLELRILPSAPGAAAPYLDRLLADLSLLEGKRPGEQTRKALALIRSFEQKDDDRSGRLDFLLGKALALDGDLQGAVLALERAVRLSPDPRAEKELAGARARVLPDLVSFASIDARLADLETLLPAGARWRLFRGRREPSAGLAWTAAEFDDSGWEEAAEPIGYGRDGLATVLDDMRGAYTTVYLRERFRVDDPNRYVSLRLALLIDDGCVVWLNGGELGRVRAGAAGAPIPFNGLAEKTAPEPPAEVTLPVDTASLRTGENLLAIQVVNHTIGSPDLLLHASLLGELRPNAESDRARFAEFLGAARGPDAPARIAYLEGRILERAGKPAEAADQFEAAAMARGLGVEAALGLARCLRALGQPSRAAARLRDAIAGGAADDDDVWRQWLAVAFGDLKLSAREALSSLPPLAGAGGHAVDVLDGLRELAETGAIRINAGGKEWRSPTGVVFGRDRFFSGGQLGGAVEAGSEETELALYRKERWFPRQEVGLPGYHIPLPPGRWRVMLHFAELYSGNKSPGIRVFDVLMEGKPVLEGYDPFQAAGGFLKPDVRRFEVEVNDGFLDIEFVHRKENPKVSAIEVIPGNR